MLKTTNATKVFLYYGLPASFTLVAIIYGVLETRQFLSDSKQFQVEEVEVVSPGGVPAADIRASAAIPKGESIFRIDLEKARERIEKNPWVNSAVVTRVMPSKIQIQIEPQKISAILGGESLRYINEKGRAFYRLKKNDSLGYPLVQLEGAKSLDKASQDKIATALEVLKELRGSEIFSESDLGDITVRMAQEEATFLFSLKFPPAKLAGSGTLKPVLYTASFGESDIPEQVRYWSFVVRKMVQTGKNPRLIRLELGKKVVVKLQR